MILQHVAHHIVAFREYFVADAAEVTRLVFGRFDRVKFRFVVEEAVFARKGFFAVIARKLQLVEMNGRVIAQDSMRLADFAAPAALELGIVRVHRQVTSEQPPIRERLLAKTAREIRLRAMRREMARQFRRRRDFLPAGVTLVVLIHGVSQFVVPHGRFVSELYVAKRAFEREGFSLHPLLTFLFVLQESRVVAELARTNAAFQTVIWVFVDVGERC